jgi:hypothetical protein
VKNRQGPYASVNDVAGIEIRALLTYRAAADAWARQIKTVLDRTPDTPVGRFFRKIIGGQRVQIENGPRVLQDLEAAVRNRNPIRFDERAACYFGMVFPAIKASPQPSSEPRPLLVPANLLHAIRRSEELLMASQLMRQPASCWTPEARIFEKERLYETRLRDDGDFKAAISRLQNDHADSISKLGASIVVHPDGPAPDDNEFIRDVTLLCHDWALHGLTATLEPMAGRFRISMEREGLRVAVPAYMKFDWRRDFPTAVAHLLHERGHFMAAIRPLRLYEQERSSGWSCSNDRLLAEYDRLDPKIRSGRRGVLYEALAASLPITGAEGPDDIHRVVRRRLQAALDSRQQR